MFFVGVWSFFIFINTVIIILLESRRSHLNNPTVKKKKLHMSFFFLFLLVCLLFTLCNFVFNFFELNFLSYLRTCKSLYTTNISKCYRKNVTLVHILRNNTSTYCLYNGNNRSLKKINNFYKKIRETRYIGTMYLYCLFIYKRKWRCPI